MAEGSNISWTDDTFNPWEGCQKVGPGCDGCYAEARNIRYAEKGATEAPNWGPGAPRRRTSAANWRKPLKWNREQGERIRAAQEAGEPAPPARFVFCASLADVFDNAVPLEWRQDLFALIRETPNLTWLLLTKRPSMIERLWFKSDGSNPWPSNAAIGCTVVNQAEADRDIPHLLEASLGIWRNGNGGKPAFTFLSMEPLLGPVDLTDIPAGGDYRTDALLAQTWIPRAKNSLPGLGNVVRRGDRDYVGLCHGVDWVITGGETDQGHHKARPAHPEWFRSLRDQCAAAGRPFHHKQNGEWVGTASNDGHWPVDAPGHIRLNVDGSRSATGWPMQKVGKVAAGRMLDGQTHDARPTPRA